MEVIPFSVFKYETERNRQGSLETALLSMYVSGAFRKLIHDTRFDHLRIAGNDRHRLRSLPVLLKDMHVGRTIVAFLVALSLAMLPMSRVFAMAAMANGETTATNDMVAMQHHHCDHDAMPADHGMKDRPASADCAAKCGANAYAVVFFGAMIPPPIGGMESSFVSSPLHSQPTNPPFRPPRI